MLCLKLQNVNQSDTLLFSKSGLIASKIASCLHQLVHLFNLVNEASGDLGMISKDILIIISNSGETVS